MTNEGTKFFDLTITKVTTVLINVSTRHETKTLHSRPRPRPRQYTLKTKTNTKTVKILSRDETVSRDFPSLEKWLQALNMVGLHQCTLYRRSAPVHFWPIVQSLSHRLIVEILDHGHCLLYGSTSVVFMWIADIAAKAAEFLPVSIA